MFLKNWRLSLHRPLFVKYKLRTISFGLKSWSLIVSLKNVFHSNTNTLFSLMMLTCLLSFFIRPIYWTSCTVVVWQKNKSLNSCFLILWFCQFICSLHSFWSFILMSLFLNEWTATSNPSNSSFIATTSMWNENHLRCQYHFHWNNLERFQSKRFLHWNNHQFSVLGWGWSTSCWFIS